VKFGNSMRELRKAMMLSQRELGEKIDVPQTTISDWETGKYLPDVYQASKLAKALGVPLDDLVDRKSA